MKIDTNELQQLAAAQPRMDMYTGIHKAIRACMADALLNLGRADVQDECELDDVTGRVLDLLALSQSHLRHENDFVHRAIEARAAGGSAAIAHDHGEHEQHIATLQAATQALRAAAPELRQPAANLLYRELAGFIAENFRHMAVEETAHNALLWEHYTDSELVDIHDALVASIPPQEMMRVARWLVPFLNPAERAALLADMRAKAPPPAFDAMVDGIRPLLRGDEWAKLSRALALAAAPGQAEG